MTKTTTTTAEIRKGLLELPTISASTADDLTRRLAMAEREIAEAQRKFDDQIKRLASEITDAGDGWTLKEIAKTSLNRIPAVMDAVRENLKTAVYTEDSIRHFQTAKPGDLACAELPTA